MDEHGKRRVVTAGYLPATGDPRAVEPLCAALKDENENVRIVVAKVLGEVGDQRAREPLTALLMDKDKNVCRAATRALKKLRAVNKSRNPT